MGKPAFSHAKTRAQISCAFVFATMSLLPYNNEKFRSFKSKENIHKKEVGPLPFFCGCTAPFVSGLKILKTGFLATRLIPRPALLLWVLSFAWGSLRITSSEEVSSFTLLCALKRNEHALFNY